MAITTNNLTDMAKKVSNGKGGVNPLKIQNFLGGIDYPVGKLDLLKKARENGASQDVMNILERINDKEYTNPAEVTKEAAGVAQK